MSTPILATKLFFPPPRLKDILRPRLIERLNEGINGKLCLISAPAGFGKTTLVADWVAGCGRPVAWLSLDEGDHDPTRFLTYFIAALQTILPKLEDGVWGLLQSPQPPDIESILTILLNEISAVPDHFVLVLDDYHVMDSKLVDELLTFLVDHLPAQMHVLIVTREDPPLPLARLRVRGQLTELRAADLRFTPAEATDFLNQVMHLNLTVEDISALETRTEGWIAGLQLAALAMLAMQGREKTTNFIHAFTGSHHFILDYLIEEVLQQQSEDVLTFLLRTSILDRMCGPLCDAVLGHPSISGQENLEMLERANLFIVPLDSERRWYRYHHLFGDLLRQRYQQSARKSPLDGSADIAELNIRASQWFEENGLGIEAFHYAAVANDMDRAERLMEGKGIPLHLSSTITTILNWLASLPASTMDARPLLWVRSATMLLINGQSTGVEEKLQAGEKAITACLNGAEPDEKNRDLIGQIAAARATLALSLYQVGEIISQSQRAMEYLAPDNLAYRFTAIWTLANAYLIQGNRTEAGETFTKAVEISRISGEPISIILALSGLAQVQELENQLYSAEETYRQVLQLVGELPLPNACVAELGLARIYYEWNDLSAAELHGQQSLKLARQYDRVIDRSIMSDVFLARLKLAQGDVAGAAAMITGAEESVRRLNFVERMPDLAAAKVLVLIRQGDLSAAAHLATAHNLHLSQARVYLAEGNPSAALANLEPLLLQMEAQGWVDEYLKVMILLSLVLHANGEKEKALHWLGKALSLAEPGGFIRIFVDEGTPMVSLLLDAASEGIRPDYIRKLLPAFEGENQKSEDKSVSFPAQYPIGPLSHRELEILKLIARGLSNREIGERLFLALDTIKGHNRRIFDKLQVQNRTEAIARAREMDLL